MPLDCGTLIEVYEKGHLPSVIFRLQYIEISNLKHLKIKCCHMQHRMAQEIVSAKKKGKRICKTENRIDFDHSIVNHIKAST